MNKVLIQYIKNLLIFVLDLIHRTEKYVQYLLTGKHEFERICESPCDTYEKAFRLDQWLTKTSCPAIVEFLHIQFDSRSEDHHHSTASRAIERVLARYECCDRDENSRDRFNQGLRKRHKSRDRNKATNPEQIVNLEDGDQILAKATRNVTFDLVSLIKRTKGRHKLGELCEDTLIDVMYRIVAYKMSLLTAERIASIRYDPNLEPHTSKLMSLWNNLVTADLVRSAGDTNETDSGVIPSESRCEIPDKHDIVSGRWSFIGFQGQDPGTDFRGMGLLGLEQLEYLSRKPKNLPIDLLRRSLNRHHEYPWAIVGINLTYNLLCLFRDGSMKHLYYDDGELLFRKKRLSLNLLKLFNDLYVELFLRFDCFWHESKPENLLAFRGLIENFVGVVKTDLCNRNFSFKFIY